MVKCHRDPPAPRVTAYEAADRNRILDLIQQCLPVARTHVLKQVLKTLIDDALG